MFRVFSKFNALFFRPRIKGAIQEYQTQLIERVKEDIRALHDMFKTQYPNSEVCAHTLTSTHIYTRTFRRSQWPNKLPRYNNHTYTRTFKRSQFYIHSHDMHMQAHTCACTSPDTHITNVIMITCTRSHTSRTSCSF